MRKSVTGIRFAKAGLPLLVVGMLLLTNYLFAQAQVETITAPFNGSGDVSLGPDGNLYVGDFGAFLSQSNGTTVKRITPDGTVSVFASGLNGASGNEFAANGDLYQSNISGGRISRITPNGVVSTFTSTNITGPVGIAIDDSGNVYSTNCITPPSSITKTTPGGVSTILVSSSLLSCPNGLTVDPDGNLYTCNFNNGWIVKITPDGTASNFVFIEGNNNGHITYSNGKLYVVARCANKIFEVSLDGTIRHIAGSGGRGNTDGSALQATFSVPNGITASRTGDTLYVNDATTLTGGCFNGSLNPVVIRMITNVLVDVPGDPLPQIESFDLAQNFPNPFNPSTHIRFSLQTAGWTSLKVYDLSGKEVRTLVNGLKSAGKHEIRFEATDLAGGIYFYRLKHAGQVLTRRMVLLQ